MRIPYLPLVAAAALFAAPAAAQCSDLSVTQDGNTYTVEVSGSTADAATVVLVGQEGSTAVQFGILGSLELGLAAPFAPLVVGFADATGALSQDITVPDSLPAFEATLQAVGVEIGFDPAAVPPVAFSFCTSNTVAVSGGS